MAEVVITCGYPAAGKTSVIQPYLDRGYKRLNRDIMGGSLEGISRHLDILLSGTEKPDVIIDNTYLTANSRSTVLEVVKKHNIPIRCLWLTTSLENCAFNNCLRMIRKHGTLLSNDEIKKSKDPNALPPAALFGARKEFENPTAAEGFSSIDVIKFERKWDASYKNKALILDFDGCLRVCKSGAHYPCDINDIQILPNRSEVLKRYLSEGYLLLGASNQSGIAKGVVSQVQAIACFIETCKLLDVNIKFSFCSHRVPPITCFCRKPGVGMGVEFIEKYKLRPSDCIFVGDLTTDKTFAERCGFKFIHSDIFFK